MAGKTSIVTGGAQGIAKSFTGVLLEDGYKVSASVSSQQPGANPELLPGGGANPQEGTYPIF